MSTQETTSTAQGRERDGRFAKGNPGGPGNPFARAVASLRTRLLQHVTEGDVDAVADQLIRQARGGDLAAIRLFLLYVLGRPAAAVDPDGLDAQELALLRRESAGFDVFTPILNGLPAQAALIVLRELLPRKAVEYLTQLAGGARAPSPQQAQAPPPAQPSPAQAKPPAAPAGPQPQPPAPRAEPAVNKPRQRRDAQPRPEPAPLPSVEEVLAMTGHVVPAAPLPRAVPSEGDQSPPAPGSAVSKRGETGRRAANDGRCVPPAPPPG